MVRLFLMHGKGTMKIIKYRINLYPFSVHVVTFNFITNLMHFKNYHNSHFKHTR